MQHTEERTTPAVALNPPVCIGVHCGTRGAYSINVIKSSLQSETCRCGGGNNQERVWSVGSVNILVVSPHPRASSPPHHQHHHQGRVIYTKTPHIHAYCIFRIAHTMAEQQQPPAVAASTEPETTTTTTAPAVATPAPPPQVDLVPGEDPEDDDDDDADADADSALGSNALSSTASVTASILEYRTIHGRTFHSDRHPTEYFTPNDEQQMESVDITHHYLTVLLDNKLFLAPIKPDVQRVVDIGTGSGIWAIDFADQFPAADIVGSDLSPCQPKWVPPNVRFQVDDATLSWTWKDNSFDFVHIRYLFGAIQDWNGLFKEAFRCCAPGGWVQSCEADVHFFSDDGTTDAEPVLKTWDKLYTDGGKATGRNFFILDDQRSAFKAAGFEDVNVVNYKLPVGGWPKDSKLAEVGNFVKLTMENDIEGYTLLLWHNVLNWPKDEYQIFLMGMRQALRNRKMHAYMKVRYVYGRKPETA
ncbi:S-adenosyl-L-methionine-dependent methyltransferase [Ilyonectria robusta]|uniref:S-adenosyl-L-methionine-dependent methyltransferase n=1 Tax=Ilyonectria robusta TaxID=1079257 RepID=UPI001E8E0E2D|nr:S-adenosyl-L-methionine-dependent methyltransferase [Ilyonectria robusta]KAH8714422.1 S-adenosyl-L-methionine-dependent methyltransferase [Ilyonectria robusta]